MSEKNKSIFAIVSEYISEKWNEHQAQKEREKKKQEKQFMLQIIYEMMWQMAMDFSATFSEEFHHLVPIDTFETIRIKNFKITNGVFQYQFSIGKKSPGKLTSLVLKSIQDRMNDNIKITRRNMINCFGLDAIRQNYPFLASGMWVELVQDMHPLEVIVTIRTNLTPQHWKQLYHQ